MNGKRESHSITRGWIGKKIFRRVHPEANTIGGFLKKEICGPFDTGVVVGATDADINNYAPCGIIGNFICNWSKFYPANVWKRCRYEYF